jgi:type I restriction enzyme, S subunit
MRSNYKRLGNYIKLVEGRNTVLQTLPLMGLSITKKFIPSIANLVGTDMTTYRTILRNQFAYSPVTSRNGDKITIALFDDYDKALISQAYTPFEVIDKKELLPEYLMMWFRRTEFDRYARFMSHGSARELFSWEDLCDLQMPIPTIAKQKEIVKEYNVIQNRIALNKQLIQKLEETAQAIYKQWFVDFEFPDENGMPYKSSGGEMVFNEELEKEIPKGWEVKAFTDIVKLSGGGTPDTANEEYWNGNIAFFTPADVVDSYYSVKTEKSVSELGLKNSSTRLYPKNTVFVTARGTVGAISIAGCEMTMNQSCYAITGTKDINQFFVHQLTLDAIAKLINEASGAVFAALVTKDFDSQEIIEPVKELIKIYGIKLNPIYDFILNTVQQNQKLIEMSNLLLSKLATIEN